MNRPRRTPKFEPYRWNCGTEFVLRTWPPASHREVLVLRETLERLLERPMDWQESTYELNAAFLDALEETRPALTRYLREARVKEVKLSWSAASGRSGRHRLTFPGMKVPSPGEPADDDLPEEVLLELDRQLYTDDACVVLDCHPDRLI